MMKKIAKHTALIGLIAASLSAPALSNNIDRGGAALIRFAGSMKWDARCEIERADGKSASIVRRGKGSKSIKSMALKRVTSGECTVNVPSGSEVMIAFDDRGLGCPFAKAGPNCMVAVKDKGKLVFNFKSKN